MFCFQKRKAEDKPSEKEEEDKTSDDTPKGDSEDEEVPSTAAEPEKKAEEAKPVPTQAKRPKSVNPYGIWEQIQQEEDP